MPRGSGGCSVSLLYLVRVYRFYGDVVLPDSSICSQCSAEDWSASCDETYDVAGLSEKPTSSGLEITHIFPCRMGRV